MLKQSHGQTAGPEYWPTDLMHDMLHVKTPVQAGICINAAPGLKSIKRYRPLGLSGILKINSTYGQETNSGPRAVALRRESYLRQEVHLQPHNCHGVLDLPPVCSNQLILVLQDAVHQLVTRMYQPCNRAHHYQTSRSLEFISRDVSVKAQLSEAKANSFHIGVYQACPGVSLSLHSSTGQTSLLLAPELRSQVCASS